MQRCGSNVGNVKSWDYDKECDLLRGWQDCRLEIGKLLK